MQKLSRFLDVFFLRRFTPSNEENNDLIVDVRKVDTVALSIVDPEFMDTAADRLYISEIAKLDSSNSHGYTVRCPFIT